MKRRLEISFLEGFAAVAGLVAVALVLVGRGDATSHDLVLAGVGLVAMLALVWLRDAVAGDPPGAGGELMRYPGNEAAGESWRARYDALEVVVATEPRVLTPEEIAARL